MTTSDTKNDRKSRHSSSRNMIILSVSNFSAASHTMTQCCKFTYSAYILTIQ